MIRKLAGWAVLGLVLFYAISNPTATASTLRHLGAGLARLASALVGGGQ